MTIPVNRVQNDIILRKILTQCPHQICSVKQDK